jgi:glycosyltransferase involved in cell wall biosynthesis
MNHIIFLVTKDDVGGAQKYAADLANHLDKNLFRSEVVMGGRDARWLSNAFRPYFLFFNDWLAIFELIKIFRARRPQIVHLNNSKAGVIGALAAKIASRKIKVVFTAHGWVFNPDNHDSVPRRKFYIFLHRLAAKFQDAIINVSEHDHRLALQYKIAPPEKLITIHNGIDAKNLKFLNRESARRALLEIGNWKLEINGPWIGSVGRLVKEKDYLTFVEAAARIDNPAIRFFIIGSGPEKVNILNRIKTLKLEEKFFLLGQIPESAQYLKAFNVFALSSIKEGLPYTLLEAIAAEIPVVATNTGGIPEIIRPYDALVPIRDPMALAEAISSVLDNPTTPEKNRERLARLRTNFSIERMIKETEKIYHQLMVKP